MADFTFQQYGTWDGSTWTDGVGVIGGSNEVWAQWIKPTLVNSLVNGWTLFVPSGFSEAGTLSIWGTRVPVLADFSSSNPPRPGNTVLNNTETFTWNAFIPRPIQLPFTDPIYGQRLILSAQLQQYGIADPNSQYRIALRFTWSGTGGTWDNAPSFTITHSTEHFTGLEGPWKALGRADHCPKCGLPSTRDTWVRDRFSDKMVCKRCYDPLSFEDVDRKRLVGREREGIGEG